jgi:two-component system, chemotaxis family, sensor kinase CheA
MELADGITQEDLNLFLQESKEQLQLLDEDFVRMEKEAGDATLIQEIFRAAHTLKGSSAMIGHQRMSHLAHAMENVLDRVRKGTLEVDPQIVDALLNSLDAMRALNKELISPEAGETDITSAVAALEAVMTGEVHKTVEKKEASAGKLLAVDEDARAKLEQALATGHQAFKLRIAINPKSTWAAVRCFQVLQALTPVSEIINSVPSKKEIEEEKVGFELHLLITAGGDESEIKNALSSIGEIDKIDITPYAREDLIVNRGNKVSSQETVTARREEANQTVRVDVARLDALMEQVGELVINRNRISQVGKMLGERYREDELIQQMGDSLSQIGKIVSMLQDDIMTIRMLPIEIVFNTLPRMVRDLARKSNKKINFIVEGEETEVDRSVIEHMRDPLIHLLRNCVDHGIEAPQDRVAAGKAETGTIRLSAYHQEDTIVIIVSDDGRGIDSQAVKEAAVKKGLIASEEAAKLTEAEAVNLIFKSGVSTAKKVTEVSGRGVGMDVVRKNLEVLNASINVDTRIGEGTQFKLILPLTLAIIPALLVSIGNTTCAIPLSNIVEAEKLEPEAIKTVRGKEVALFRGSVLPLLRLSTTFGWETGALLNKRADHLIVVKVGDTQIGLIVDALIEQQELVVKSLDQLVGGANGITGASILGDGQVVLILDIPSMVKGVMEENQNKERIEKDKLLASSRVG